MRRQDVVCRVYLHVKIMPITSQTTLSRTLAAGSAGTTPWRTLLTRRLPLQREDCLTHKAGSRPALQSPNIKKSSRPLPPAHCPSRGAIGAARRGPGVGALRVLACQANCHASLLLVSQ